MHRNQPRFVVALFRERCRELFQTKPAPASWFDPRPNRRVRCNTWRRAEPARPTER